VSVGRILVVDDDEAIRVVITEALRQDGHDVRTAASVAEQVLVFESFDPDVLITDVMLPDGNGLDQLPGILAQKPGLPIIILSAQNTLTTAVRATEQGAFEYLPKPFDLDELCRAVRDGLKRRINKDVTIPASPDGDMPLIGRSPAMQEVYRTIARVVPNDLSVLILGESGTGKELVARAVHDLGPRKKKPFVAVNMAAIPRELVEADLFGHERGAFTGAQSRVAGKFERAEGGTLFLDEIGDMPMEAQTRLLRVLQSGEFTMVGGSRLIRANVRVIAATHKDLLSLIGNGSFREDLYYRLNVVPLTLPALRNRGSDIALLARHFLDAAAGAGLPRKTLAVDASQRLVSHNWPGNVRELENLMQRLAVLARDDVIDADLLDQHLTMTSMGAGVGYGAGSYGAGRSEAAPFLGESALSQAVELHLAGHFSQFGDMLPPDGLYFRILDQVEVPLLRATLAAVRGNQLKAARLLGINRNTLRKKLADHGLNATTGRPKEQ
jgi:two-component system, NtrC family, nitrogen regulation response regulator GlnG